MTKIHFCNKCGQVVKTISDGKPYNTRVPHYGGGCENCDKYAGKLNPMKKSEETRRPSFYGLPDTTI